MLTDPTAWMLQAGLCHLSRRSDRGGLRQSPNKSWKLGGVEEPDGSPRMHSPHDRFFPAARVIMVPVDELPLAKRLVAHVAGVLLCLQKQVEQLLRQPVARNPVLPVRLFAGLR